jgi:hypothetical protein
MSHPRRPVRAKLRAVQLWRGRAVSDYDSIRRLAAKYRERAAATIDIAQRSRHLAFAEHCEWLAPAMMPRPKGMATRLVGGLLRSAMRLAQTAGAT